MADYINSDWAWLAVDSVGRVAALTTAGVAPIPLAVLEHPDWVEPAEDWITELPARGGFEMLINYPQPESFVSLASRGFYAYDWYSVHRKTGKTRAYELVAKPIAPIHVDDLAPDLAKAALLVVFESISFESTTLLAVEALVSCQVG